MAIELLTPVLEGGVRHNHFFEGRLLSGRDLRDEQEANRLNRRQLGRAVGAGVVEGLTVTRAGDAADGSPVLTVAAGLAFNRKGQPLELPHRTDVRLVRDFGDIPEDAGLFHPCDPALNTLVPSGIGLYLLVMSPISGYAESAPKSGLGEGGKVAGCGKRYEVEGVQFRLEKLNPSDATGISDATRNQLTTLLPTTDPAGRSLLRNLAAHLCFGTERLAQAPAEAGELASDSPYLSYGALDDLLAVGTLTDCDVPLGLFQWALGGLGFLDQWSVRRRVHPAALGRRATALLAERRLAEGEAILAQFQEHLEELRASLAAPAAAVGLDYFRYLPAAGLLAEPGATPGFDPITFFTTAPHRDPIEFVNGEQLPELFRRSLAHDPIDLSLAEMVWLYRPWQQGPALDAGETTRAYTVFASAHLPPYATARFDVARWDYSNYSNCHCGG